MPPILSTSHCEFYGARSCAHARKIILLAPIYPFNRQIVPLVFEELLTWSSSTSVTSNFCNSHTKSFLSSKKFYAAVVFSFFVSFFYFIAHVSWACVTPMWNPAISIWNIHLVHILICLITHSFLHGFQPNLYQHFSYVCSTRQTTFSIKQIPQCIWEILLHYMLIVSITRTPSKLFEWNFRYINYIDTWIFTINLKKLWHFSLSKLGFNHFIHVYATYLLNFDRIRLALKVMCFR